MMMNYVSDDRQVVFCAIIDGIIGSGKSSLLQSTMKLFAEDSKLNEEINLIPFFEPSDEFNRYKQFHPLSLFSQDKKTNGFPTQLHIIKCINNAMQNVLSSKLTNEHKHNILISDRSLYSPLVFSSLLRQTNIINEFSYQLLVEETIREAAKIEQEYNIEYLMLYQLETPVDICMERIESRARDYEINGGVDRKYLMDMCTCYTDHSLWWSGQLGPTYIIKSKQPNAEHLLSTVIEKYRQKTGIASSKDKNDIVERSEQV